MKRFLSTLFGISNKEFSGFLLVFLILILTLFYPLIADRFYGVDEKTNESDQAVLDSLLERLRKQKAAKYMARFHFDPNTATQAELDSLGFAEITAKNLVSYRNKGGKFRVKDDLLKIYSIDTVLFSQLYNYIDLPETLEKGMSKPVVRAKELDNVVTQQKKEYKKENTKLPPFDLNTADSVTLQSISGIGPVLSKRIIRFREGLGGFVTNNQLYEVYNLDSTTIQKLVNRSFIQPDFVPRKISINKTDEKTLQSHPYFSWQQARLIIAYRNQHGDFLTQEDLLKVYSITKIDLQKMKAYIDWSASQ